MLPPDDWGVLLVRKGGFAVARLAGERVVESKVGQRHVQGRTKAGGQSQQRFARRRDNQARQAYEAAADHAVRILGQRPLVVVAGGDRAAVDEVLADPRLEQRHGRRPLAGGPRPEDGASWSRRSVTPARHGSTSSTPNEPGFCSPTCDDFGMWQPEPGWVALPSGTGHVDASACGAPSSAAGRSWSSGSGPRPSTTRPS